MKIFEHWKETRDESNSKDFHGYSIDIFRNEYKYNFFAALLTLDWIVKKPDEALPELAKKMYIITKNNE